MKQEITKADAWLVVCLCADWCGTCKQYRQPFEALAAQFPQMRFVWLDVEDREDVAGDLDIETFPSILVAQGEQARFLGPVLPQTGVLARMLQSLPQMRRRGLPMCRRPRICCSDCCALMTCRKSCVDRCFMRDTFCENNGLRLQSRLHDQTGGYIPPVFFGQFMAKPVFDRAKSMI
jgi:hypothetical protein